MDWSKAKNILLILFITLNIFLLVNIVFTGSEKTVSKETLTNVKTILKERGITLTCEIPNYKSNPGRLKIQSFEYNKEKIAQLLFGTDQKEKNGNPNIIVNAGQTKQLRFNAEGNFEYQDTQPSASMDISNSVSIDGEVRKLVGQIGVPVDQFRLDHVIRETDGSLTLEYIQQYRKFNVFDNVIVAKVGKDGIRELTCTYKKVKGLESSKSEVSPVHTILLNYYNNNPAVITRIDYGFAGYNTNGAQIIKSSESFAWRIRAEGEKDRFFNRDGEEITKSSGSM